MAEADGTTSTTDSIWLREALALAVAALGSVALAKEQLREWLAAGKVPWSCMWWKGLNAEDLADLKQERDGLFAFSSRLFTSAFAPSAAYCPGDPEFWNAGLKINWEDDGAYELARLDGAQALGIKVSRAHVQALLPAEPSKPDEARGAGAWIATEARRLKKAGEIPQGIRITDFARKLAGRMRKAAASDRSIRPVEAPYIKNKLRDWGLWPVSLIG